MRTFALCAASFKESVRQAAGVQPLLSPPVRFKTFARHLVEGYDFIYFKLHGLPGHGFWYGDRWTVTMSAQQISQANLTDTIIFVANCHLYTIHKTKMVPSTMLQALLYAGARAVVGGNDINYARSRSVRGTDTLGLYFRYMCQAGIQPYTAYLLARARISLRRRKTFATEDALTFQYFDQVFFKESLKC